MTNRIFGFCGGACACVGLTIPETTLNASPANIEPVLGHFRFSIFICTTFAIAAERDGTRITNKSRHADASPASALFLSILSIQLIPLAIEVMAVSRLIRALNEKMRFQSSARHFMVRAMLSARARPCRRSALVSTARRKCAEHESPARPSKAGFRMVLSCVGMSERYSLSRFWQHRIDIDQCLRRQAVGLDFTDCARQRIDRPTASIPVSALASPEADHRTTTRGRYLRRLPPVSQNL